MFRKWINKLVVRALHDEQNKDKMLEVEPCLPYAQTSNKKLSRGLSLSNRPNTVTGYNGDVAGMTFTVYNALGGHAVEFKKYNEQQDRNDVRLYIIPEAAVFSDELGKIITLESMRG